MSQVVKKEKDNKTCGDCKWIHLCGKTKHHKACSFWKEKENEVKKDD